MENQQQLPTRQSKAVNLTRQTNLNTTKTNLSTTREYSSNLSLTSALDGVDGQRHAPGRFTPGGRPGTHCTGGWVGPMNGLDRCGKSRLHRDSIPGRPALASRYTD